MSRERFLSQPRHRPAREVILGDPRVIRVALASVFLAGIPSTSPRVSLLAFLLFFFLSSCHWCFLGKRARLRNSGRLLPLQYRVQVNTPPLALPSSFIGETITIDTIRIYSNDREFERISGSAEDTRASPFHFSCFWGGIVTYFTSLCFI